MRKACKAVCEWTTLKWFMVISVDVGGARRGTAAGGFGGGGGVDCRDR